MAWLSALHASSWAENRSAAYTPRWANCLGAVLVLVSRPRGNGNNTQAAHEDVEGDCVSHDLMSLATQFCLPSKPAGEAHESSDGG